MNIPSLRLANQQVTQQDLVSYMGAIQAQDYPMSKWAIGLILPWLVQYMPLEIL